MNSEELDAEIRDRVAEQIAERAKRRQRMRKARRQFDQRRRYGLEARKQQRMGRGSTHEQEEG